MQRQSDVTEDQVTVGFSLASQSDFLRFAFAEIKQSMTERQHDDTGGLPPVREQHRRGQPRKAGVAQVVGTRQQYDSTPHTVEERRDQHDLGERSDPLAQTRSHLRV